jgi:hypothetical protein
MDPDCYRACWSWSSPAGWLVAMAAGSFEHDRLGRT